jgi:hypothetical protein
LPLKKVSVAFCPATAATNNSLISDTIPSILSH